MTPRLIIDGDVALNGEGSVRFSRTGAYPNQSRSVEPADVLTIGVQQRITTDVNRSGTIACIVDNLGTIEAAEGTINVNGTILGYDGATDTLTGGTLAPGASPGPPLTTGHLTLEDGVVYDWEVSSDAQDLVIVEGDLTFGNSAVLDVLWHGTELPAPGDYVLFSVTGQIDTLPGWTINLPDEWTSGPVVVLGDDVMLTGLEPIAEPSTLVLLGMGAVGLLVCGRRKRQG